MNIPTYNAQIQSVSVPKLDASMEQNNNDMIYQGMARFAKDVSDTAFAMYEIEQEEKAKTQGAEAGSNKDLALNELPEANTRVQQIYNQSAVDNYAVNFAVDGTHFINQTKHRNKDNPAQFLTEADSYIRGSSENIPERYRRQIIYPLQVQAEAAYNSLLNAHVAKQREQIKQGTLFNLEFLKNNIANLDYTSADPTVIKYNNEQYSTYVNALKGAVNDPNIGIKASDALKSIEKLNQSVAFSYVNSMVRDTSMNAKQIHEFQNDVVAGKTGFKAVDSLSPIDRAKLANGSFDIIKEMDDEEKRVETQNIEKAQKSVDDFEMGYNDLVLSGKPIPEEVLISLRRQAFDSASTPEQQKQAMNIGGNININTPDYIKRRLIEGKTTGDLSLEDVQRWNGARLLSPEDYKTAIEVLNTPLARNKKTNAYQQISESIKTMYPTKNLLGFSSAGDNEKRDFVEQNLNLYLSGGLRTDEEIYAQWEKIQKEARSIKGTVKNYDIFPSEIKDVEPYVVPVLKKYAVRNEDVGFTFDFKSVSFLQDVLYAVREKNPGLGEEAVRREANKILSVLKHNFGEK